MLYLYVVAGMVGAILLGTAGLWIFFQGVKAGVTMSNVETSAKAKESEGRQVATKTVTIDGDCDVCGNEISIDLEVPEDVNLHMHDAREVVGQC